MTDAKRYKQRLSELVAIPSISCTSPKHDMSNLAVLELLASWLQDLGFTCDIHHIPDAEGKANLVAVKGRGPGGIVLSGHSDTVPCDPDLWQQDPFKLLEADDRLYGLGSTDMKGFFPVILEALEKTKDLKLNAPIVVLATADEESSMSGARALVDQNIPRAKCAVIGEPTNLRPIRMHKGIMMESVRVEGKAGHSSNPALGLNALEVMHEIISDLRLFRGDMQARYSNPGFEVSVPTMNLGCIHGGDNPNRICGRCELHFDLRPLPGMEPDALRQEISNRLIPIAERTGSDIVFSSLFPGVKPFEEDKASDIVRVTEKLTGYQSESVAFATEAPFLQGMGMETIVMGPGSIEQAHQPNEFIACEQINPAVNILVNLIKQYCVSE